MRDQSANHPRDAAIQAAQHDEAILAGILEDEFQASYRGPERSEHVRVLAGIISGLGGSLEVGASSVLAAIDDRRITIRFGNR